MRPLFGHELPICLYRIEYVLRGHDQHIETVPSQDLLLLCTFTRATRRPLSPGADCSTCGESCGVLSPLFCC